MKQTRILVLLAGLLLSASVKAQNADSVQFAREYARYLGVFQAAQAFADPEIEKVALYNLFVMNPGDSTVLRTLGNLYYNSGRYTSSALIGMDFLKKFPGTTTALELCALSYEQLRLYDRAVEYYEQLYLKDDSNVKLLYQIAYLQYSLKRFDESTNNLNIVERNADAEETVQLSTTKGTMQVVKLKAALFNLRGLIAVEQGKNDDARTHFGEALKISPDFEAPQLTLDALNKGN